MQLKPLLEPLRIQNVKMNLLPQVIDKVRLFENEREITLMLVDPNVQNANDQTKGVLSEMFLTLDDNSAAIKREWLTEALRSIAYYNEMPPFFRVNRGEDFSIAIDLEQGRDFTGFALTIRRADDGTLLSPDDTQGDSYSDAATQYAYINDLALTEKEFFKVNVLVEETDTENLANGNAVTLLTPAWLLVGASIDA